MFDLGLSVPVRSPPPPRLAETAITAEAGIAAGPDIDFRVEPLVQAGDLVAQGAPVLRGRSRPELVVTAPMAGRVAELELGAGRRLASLVLHAAEAQVAHAYDVGAAAEATATSLRGAMQASGLWMRLRARPFGGVPAPEAVPAAIFVMAADTRPHAPDPRLALTGDAADHFTRGLQALARLTTGRLYLCQDRGPDLASGERVEIVRVGTLHPHGLAGIQIHRHHPALPDRPVWDIAAEDAAAIGHLLTEGRLPATRLVSVAGPGLRAARLVRCQPGADLRALTFAQMTPGPRAILSGSAIEGREGRWLAPRDRQVTVLARAEPTAAHWLGGALRRASRPEPIIATAAVEQALGGALPAMPLLRALAVGDDEAAVQLGALSLLEEDLALVDYVTGAEPRSAALLRAMLDRIEAEA